MSIHLGLDLCQASMSDAIEAMIEEWLKQQDVDETGYVPQIDGMEGISLPDAIEVIIRTWLIARTGEYGPVDHGNLSQHLP